MLVDQLQPDDTVSIVDLCRQSPAWCSSRRGRRERRRSWPRSTSSHAGGSTAGGEGIARPTRWPSSNFVKGGVNRVILATDGDFNVGITDPEAAEGLHRGASARPASILSRARLRPRQLQRRA